MNGRFLLDTNIVIALFAGDLSVHNHLINANEIFILAIVIGELYFGAYKSLKVSENFLIIDKFALCNTIISPDAQTAQKYGIIKNRLKEKGQPIPENDIWIAAIAEQYILTLVTRDKHFEQIANITTEIW